MSSIASLFVLTAIVSICLGVLLAYFSGLSARTKMAADQRRRDLAAVPFSDDGPADDSIRRIVESEIGKAAVSGTVPGAVAKAVSSGLAAEISKKVSGNIKQMSERYEKIIQEKGQSEEVAWKKYGKALADKQETEAVIRSVAEGLVVVDAKGQVVMMNPAAEKLLGVSSKNKIGRPVLEGARKEQLFSLAKDTPGGSKEIELDGEDDTKRTLRASSAIIENENGQTVGMVSVLNDITKQKEIDGMKASFVSSVSHELRTPLIAIEKSVALILGGTVGKVSPSQEQLLDIAHRNLKRLTLLINDLLDLSKLEASKMKLSRQPERIARVVDDCIATLDTWAKAKSIALAKQVAPDLPEIDMDANRITQVLTNLIGNAIKFTPNEGRIFVSAVRRANAQEIEVSVKDTGIGLKPEHLSKVFDKFYQVGERVSSDVNGTGIGLAISKEIVELHGGKIWVESEKGQGANFIFTLPMKA